MAGFDYSQPGAYFVTVCTREKQCVLGSVVGADAHIGPHVALTTLGETAQRYLCTIPGIDRWVVMPNHVHMILRISADDPRKGPVWEDAPACGSVPQMVRSWKTLVTKAEGRAIWQRSYYDHIIRDEAEYIRIAQYIEENPAKWAEDSYYQ